MTISQQQRHLLGSECFITIANCPPQDTGELFDELWFRVESFENRFSRFRADSELTHFNQRAGKETPVSQAFMKMLKATVALGKQTDGLYNPFILPTLQAVGYRGSWPNPQRSAQGTDFRSSSFAQIEDIVIGEDWAKIPKNTALDFGGCGKGYILDECAIYLGSQRVESYWMSFGGDIICKGNEPGKDSWGIAIQDAFDPNTQAGMFLNNGGTKMAVATSGTAKRRGKDWHHIIDPHTSKPATTDIVAASVQTESALRADVYAKCLVTLGSKQCDLFSKQHGITHGILQLQSKQVLTW